MVVHQLVVSKHRYIPQGEMTPMFTSGQTHGGGWESAIVDEIFALEQGLYLPSFKGSFSLTSAEFTSQKNFNANNCLYILKSLFFVCDLKYVM